MAGLPSVRVARPEDAPAVAAVLHASYSTLYRGWYRDDVLAAALPAMTRANPVLLASGRYFVAEIEGRVSACGGWSAEIPGGGAPHLAHVRHFATAPTFINRGLGGAILGRCFHEASAAGFTDIESISSLTAEAFYARHGFRQVAITQQPMGGVSFACVRMRRQLETAA